MKNIKMILGDNMSKYLSLNGILGADGKTSIKCLYCDENVLPNHIQFIIPPRNVEDVFKIVCSNPICIETYLSEKEEK